MISKQEEIFNELVGERLEKTTDLDKNFNSDDLIYRCKSKPADVKFDEFDNDFDIIDKIRDSKIELADVTNNQEKFKSYLKKMKKGNKSINQRSTLLKCFPKQEMKLFNFIMIIL